MKLLTATKPLSASDVMSEMAAPEFGATSRSPNIMGLKSLCGSFRPPTPESLAPDLSPFRRNPDSQKWTRLTEQSSKRANRQRARCDLNARPLRVATHYSLEGSAMILPRYPYCATGPCAVALGLDISVCCHESGGALMRHARIGRFYPVEPASSALGRIPAAALRHERSQIRPRCIPRP